MAFTDPQKASIRFWLGWPSRLYDKSSALEQAFESVGNDVDAVAIIVNVLASLDSIDLKLVDSLKRIKVQKTGTTELPGQMEVATLRSEGRRFVGRLSSTMGVHVEHDMFSSTPSRRNNTFVLA